jgi:hypothetical protein
MNSELQTIQCRQLLSKQIRSMTCYDVAAFVMQELETFRRVCLADNAVKRHKAFLAAFADGDSVSEGKARSRVRGALFAREILRWAESMVYLGSGLHPLTSTYAIDTAALATAMMFGGFRVADRRWLEFIPMVPDSWKDFAWSVACSNRLFDSQFKRRVTETIRGTDCIIRIPANGVVLSENGKVAIGPGAVFRGSILRCHLSSAFTDFTSLKCRWKRDLQVDLESEFVFCMQIPARVEGRPGLKVEVPIPWIAATTADRLEHDPNVPFTLDLDYDGPSNTANFVDRWLVPNWADRADVFQYDMNSKVESIPAPANWISRIWANDLLDSRTLVEQFRRERNRSGPMLGGRTALEAERSS